MTNYKQVWAKKRATEQRVLKIIPTLQNKSGIYVFRRIEGNIRYAYVGQAKHLMDRIVSHLLGYQQRIDISLKKRGLDVANGGWQIVVDYCEESLLDDKERDYIDTYANSGWQLYNKTIGGQDNNKSALGENESTKGYRDGLVQGYKNCLNDIRIFFEKYLDFSIKKPTENKNGKPNQIKAKKYDEFKNLLNKGQ